MKKILLTIYSFFHDVGRIRAAASLSRLGKHEEAKYIMSNGKI